MLICCWFYVFSLYSNELKEEPDFLKFMTSVDFLNKKDGQGV